MLNWKIYWLVWMEGRGGERERMLGGESGRVLEESIRFRACKIPWLRGLYRLWLFVYSNCWEKYIFYTPA
jgi:hypothetical protein